MSESAHIPRRTGEEVEDGYERLRADGIHLVQELSGKHWTDYNPHDPGLTILEQLCFALTELIYRSDFDVEDLLADSSGSIPYTDLALNPPHVVFPSRATTIDDYRKLLFDAVPELENLWIQPVPVDEVGVNGLYRIRAQVSASADSRSQSIADRIEAIYHQHRNLCEDLFEVKIVDRTDYEVRGEVEVAEYHDPIEVLGRVYFEVAQMLGRSLAYRSYGEMALDTRPLDEIFDGPLTRSAFVDADELRRGRRDSLSAMEVAEMVGGLPGVIRVEHLALELNGTPRDTITFDAFSQPTPRLRIPNHDSAIGVTVNQNGRQQPVSVDELALEVDRHASRYSALRTDARKDGALSEPPKGRPREVTPYHSIQHDFPDVYGINRFGLPGSASAHRKSQASNLKGYLLLFEQLMADFLETLGQAERIFSLDTDLDRTYFHRLLTEEEVPGVEPLTMDYRDGDGHRLGEELRQYDNADDRRNRALDYLLALHGERLGSDSLYLRDIYGDRTAEQLLIEAKVELLRLLAHEH